MIVVFIFSIIYLVSWLIPSVDIHSYFWSFRLSGACSPLSIRVKSHINFFMSFRFYIFCRHLCIYCTSSLSLFLLFKLLQSNEKVILALDHLSLTLRRSKMCMHCCVFSPSLAKLIFSFCFLFSSARKDREENFTTDIFR